ncbi:type VI secretion system-associated FHA domain protein TagH [Roseinatronobacter monicus]|uniref:FHA domain protein n=1 Tax=Roseinatronobacter monicus TaxID=393481 RepID=A0A543K4F7_9RHOB|nr:type VI secretion system-associated FHA domain protein TagH [Roseinatronobacter monicus]TQM89971.1 FHA domain protein [Roseinatronobacter monicus]
MRIRLRVENVTAVAPGRKLEATLSQGGGTIGSDPAADWSIQDSDGSLPLRVVTINVVDDQFTLEALEPELVRINGARAPIEVNRPVILRDNDKMNLGGLQVTIRLATVTAIEDTPELESLVSEESETRDTLVVDGVSQTASEGLDSAPAPAADPLHSLDKTMTPEHRKNQQTDPLAVLDELASYADQKLHHKRSVSPSTQQSDSRSEVNSAVTLPRISKDSYGFEVAPDAEAASMNAFDHDDLPVDHIALRPLSRALGLSVAEVDALESTEMLAEIGASLRAAVEGLTRIYARHQPGNSVRFPLTTMHLHAIEDNPLRFSRSSQEAMESLFIRRGAVHLSAPAAISESLTHLSQHQDATEAAVDEALSALFAALQPKALERRFAAYTRDAGPRPGPERDAWCWNMFKAYTEELSSQRQRGLQLLFWEVFSYEYQSRMRQLALKEDDGVTSSPTGFEE